MEKIKKIELNTIYTDKLNNEDYTHNYSVFLEKHKYYYIELITKNDYEFNLKIFDSSYNKINTNDNINNITSKLISYDKKEVSEENSINEEIKEHNKLIEEKFPEDTSEESTEEKEDIFQDENMKIILYKDDITDNIEIVLEITEDKVSDNDPEDYINAIQNLKRIRDYNNKIYLKAKKSDDYIINVRSEYENEEGEYSLNIKEVEDINIIFDKNIDLNQENTLKFKKKYNKEKFIINLDPNSEYNFNYDNENIKIFILGENNTFTNSGDNINNIINFHTIDGGKYILEIISNKKNIETKIMLEKVNKIIFTENNLLTNSNKPIINTNKNIVYNTEIYMKDVNTDDKYKLCINNGELLVEKVSQ